MPSYHLLATWEGYCASCDVERPLLLVEQGPRGLRAWLSGAGPEDRELSYACGVCGRVEPVPLTEAEDAEYDATLARWPDWVEPAAAAVVPDPRREPEVVVLPASDVFALAAGRITAPAAEEPVQPEPAVVRRPVVHVFALPVQRVSATDGRLLAHAAA